MGPKQGLERNRCPSQWVPMMGQQSDELSCKQFDRKVNGWNFAEWHTHKKKTTDKSILKARLLANRTPRDCVRAGCGYGEESKNKSVLWHFGDAIHKSARGIQQIIIDDRLMGLRADSWNDFDCSLFRTFWTLENFDLMAALFWAHPKVTCRKKATLVFTEYHFFLHFGLSHQLTFILN